MLSAGSTLGCVTAPRGYFAAVKAVCDKYFMVFRHLNVLTSILAQVWSPSHLRRSDVRHGT